MGDTGAMLIGLLLAYVPISSLASLDPVSLTTRAARHAGTVNRFGEILPLLLPAAILLIPYTDLLMAVFRRTRAGMSPFAPDRKHLHHRMLDIGHSHRSSVLIMYLWAALFAGSVVWLSIVRTPLFVLASVAVGGMLALLLVSMPRFRPWARPAAGAPSSRAPAGAHAAGTPVVDKGAAPSPAAPAAAHAAPSAAHTSPSATPGPAPPDPGPARPGPVHHRPARPTAPAATSRPGPPSWRPTPPAPQAAFDPAPPHDEPPGPARRGAGQGPPRRSRGHRGGRRPPRCGRTGCRSRPRGGRMGGRSRPRRSWTGRPGRRSRRGHRGPRRPRRGRPHSRPRPRRPPGPAATGRRRRRDRRWRYRGRLRTARLTAETRLSHPG